VFEPEYGRRLDAGAHVVERAERRTRGGVRRSSGGVASGFAHRAAVSAGARGERRAILTADGPIPADRGTMEDELVASGRFVRIEARGSRSGLDRPVTVGFVDDADGSGAILVAATAPDAAWANNLLADPSCHVRVGDRSFDAVAEPLEPAEHAAAVRDLILRYGTPAEGLGRGPSFRLRPVAEDRT
jgi:deazaflavin-dependent oxidoreductase (nitroreductase family)